MNVLIIGEPYFAELLATSLTKLVGGLDLEFFNTSHSRIDCIRYLLKLPVADLVFCIGGSLTGGGALRAALFCRTPILMEFIGSDVLQALKDFQAGRINKKITRNAHFFSNAPWLSDELKTANIHAPFFSDYLAGIPDTLPPPLPAKFSVLSYAKEQKEALYGVSELIRCAEKMPDVEFKLAGLNMIQQPFPPNLKILGWVESFEKELSQSTVHLRLTSHDGIAHTVVQALALGRWVIRSQKMPGTAFARTADEALPHLRELKQKFDEGTLGPNLVGYKYARGSFDQNKVANDLKRLIISTVDRTPFLTTK